PVADCFSGRIKQWIKGFPYSIRNGDAVLVKVLRNGGDVVKAAVFYCTGNRNPTSPQTLVYDVLDLFFIVTNFEHICVKVYTCREYLKLNEYLLLKAFLKDVVFEFGNKRYGRFLI